MIQLTGDHAKPGAERGHVPALLPEDSHRCHAVLAQLRAVVERQQPNERRFAGAIGAKNDRVLTRIDRERQTIEHTCSTTHERGIPQVQDWFHSPILSGTRNREPGTGIRDSGFGIRDSKAQSPKPKA
jgi:hypothetical protein